jgi:hypothetical protein
MSKLISLIGLSLSAVCLLIATRLYPGGYDWNHNYISTLIRGQAGSARNMADIAVLLFCVSVAVAFENVARSEWFVKDKTIIRTGGIGSMVYAAFTMTVLHDLVVTISLLFFIAGVIPIGISLYKRRELGFFFTGLFCFTLMMLSAIFYYTGLFAVVLPWAQRSLYLFFAIWLLALDRASSGKHLPRVAVA